MSNIFSGANSPQFNDLVAQLGHFGYGCLLVVIPALYRAPAWLGPVMVLGWSLPKEFLFDIFVEKQTALDGLKDFAFYVLGLGLGLLLLALR